LDGLIHGRTGLKVFSEMHIRLLWVGKTKEGFIREGLGLFRSRISHYASISITEVKGEKITPKSDREVIKNKEGGRLLDRLKSHEVAVALDGSGTMFSSEGFSGFLQDLETHGRNNIAFLLGGPLGLSAEVTARADYVMSLSPMTYTHEMSRLILLEQIYRAMTIIKGETYHK